MRCGAVGGEAVTATQSDALDPRRCAGLARFTNLASRASCSSYSIARRSRWGFGPVATAAQAVATEGGATFLSIDASIIENKWLGESEKNAKAVFTLARRLAPCVLSSVVLPRWSSFVGCCCCCWWWWWCRARMMRVTMLSPRRRVRTRTSGPAAPRAPCAIDAPAPWEQVRVTQPRAHHPRHRHRSSRPVWVRTSSQVASSPSPRAATRCVVYIDEIDSVLSSREHGEDTSHGTLTSVKTTLMQVGGCRSAAPLREEGGGFIREGSRRDEAQEQAGGGAH